MAAIVEFELTTGTRAETVKSVRDNAEMARDFALTLQLAIEGAYHSDLSKEDVLLALEMPIKAIIDHAEAATIEAHQLVQDLR